MDRLPLIGGSYQARSLIANCQRCVNLFPEANPKDAPVPLTHYQRPGLRPLVQGAVAPVRGLYRSSTGQGYCVIGQNFYSISANWVLTQLGMLTTASGLPVKMIDNRTDLFLVDGSTTGYQYPLSGGALSPIVDPTGTFAGANLVDYIDTFMLWNLPNNNQFGSTYSNELVFDPLYTAGKVNYPDNLVGLAVCRREIFLLGQVKSEIWYDAGNVGFPFAELPGASIEHGCVAPYSIATQDLSVFWLGQDLQGQGIVFRGRGYECTRISTHAIEFALQQYPTLADAIGYTYQQGGHVFYVLTFPSGNATWVFDDSVQIWHQRAWTDPNGNLNRDRTNCAAFINSTNVVGDWQNGTLYAQDQNMFSDTLVPGGVPGPISWIRSFPHIISGRTPQGQPILADGKRMQFAEFQADIECGNAPLDVNGQPGTVGLRWSDDRGRTWGNTVLQNAGAPGVYQTYPDWKALGGGTTRDRVFELSYSFAGQAALNGAWVDAKVLAT